MANTTRGRVGILWRAERGATLETSRFQPVAEVFRRRGLQVEAVPYSDEALPAVRAELLGLDAVLVWVDPISDRRDRFVAPIPSDHTSDVAVIVGAGVEIDIDNTDGRRREVCADPVSRRERFLAAHAIFLLLVAPSGRDVSSSTLSAGEGFA